MVAEAVSVATMDALEKVRLGELASVPEVKSYVGGVVEEFFSAYGPAMKQQLIELVKPATERAIETVRPTVEQLLKDYLPTAAAIVGGLLGLSVLLGVYVAKKTYRRTAA